MTEQYDGPTLRSVRESVGVPLRRVARLAGMSHGHLSKVERGEHGRPVTPAILAAYERATGVRLADARVVGFGDGSVDTSGAGWRRGRLSDVRRRGFNAAVAAVAVGGPVGEPIAKLIDSLGRVSVPARVGPGDVRLVEDTARLLTGADLRWGGGMVWQVGRVALRWAVGLTGARMSEDAQSRLHAAIGWLASRAGWAAFDADAHDAARNLFMVGLDAAVQAPDRSLRAHVLADVGAQHNHLGYPDDCLEIVSLVEGDRRVAAPVRAVLAGVAARAAAAAGEVAECRRHVALMEEWHAQGRDEPAAGWSGQVLSEAQVAAVTGHALAVLARRSQAEADRVEARHRLGVALAGLDPESHARAWGLCAARLAMLHLDLDDPDAEPEAVAWAGRAAEVAARIRSARLVRHLKTVRATAATRPRRPALQDLAATLHTLLEEAGSGEAVPGEAAAGAAGSGEVVPGAEVGPGPGPGERGGAAVPAPAPPADPPAGASSGRPARAFG